MNCCYVCMSDCRFFFVNDDDVDADIIIISSRVVSCQAATNNVFAQSPTRTNHVSPTDALIACRR